MQEIKIKDITEIDANRYSKHLLDNINSNIFNTLEWIRFISEFYNLSSKIICMENEKGEISTSLPFAIKKNKIISFPFTDFINVINDNKDETIKIIDEIKNYYFNNHFNKLSIRNFIDNNGFFNKKIGVLHKNLLENDFEKEIKKMKYNHKWGMKKAVKSGVNFEMSNSFESLKKYFKLHLKTRKRQGVPSQAKEFFYGLYDKILSKDLGFIGLSFINEIPIAGGVFLHFNKTITYKYGASDNNYWKLQPNNLMFYEVIRWAIENGYKIFDFGKTDIENKGLRDFKTGWGAIESDLYYSSIPEESNDTFKNFILDYIIKPVIKYSPLKVCELSGKYFYKYNI